MKAMGRNMWAPRQSCNVQSGWTHVDAAWHWTLSDDGLSQTVDPPATPPKKLNSKFPIFDPSGVIKRQL